MSTIQVNEILSRDGTKTLMKLDGGAMSGVTFGRRNLIINGAMQVAQRGTSQTSVTGGVYLLDRWKYAEGTSSGVVTMSQSADAPDTFKNSLKIEVTTADTDLSGGTQYGNIGTRLEGQDLQHLAYGTSDAKSVTLSFWVKSSNTGTYASELEHGTTGVNVQTWTIDSANTWEYKTVTFEGWTSSALPDGTGTGLYVTPVWFAAGDGISGSSFQSGWRSLTQTERLPNNIPNLFGTVGNTFYITGVQLEVGEVATPFEYRSYGEELALCQRYYEVIYSDGNGETIFSFDYNGSQNRIHWFYKVEKRAAPSFGLASGGSFDNSYTSIGSSVSRTQVYHSSPTFLKSSAGTISAYVDAEL